MSDGQLTTARTRPVRADRGPLFPIKINTLRLYAVPLPATGAGRAVVGVVALRRDQRDEALRELIGQLALANLAALAVAQATGRFTRADTSRSTPGTGLGLAVVDAIVSAHHGELRICSNRFHHSRGGHLTGQCNHPEAGTTITVLLPHRDQAGLTGEVHGVR